jgi:hypothetical protein
MTHRTAVRAVALLATGALWAAVACRDTPTAPTAEELAMARAAEIQLNGPAVARLGRFLLGTSEQLTAKVYDSLGVEITTPLKLEWSTDDPSIVEVDQSGRTTAKRAGWTMVHARVATGVSGATPLQVIDPGTAMAINPDSSRMVPGQRRRLGLQYLTLPDTMPAHGWSSSNAAAATVDDDGVVTAVAPGSTTISVPYAGRTFEAQVRVVDVATPLRFTTVAAGHYATCALAIDGAAYCWGTTRGGSLGSTEPMDRCISYWSYTIPAGAGGPGYAFGRDVAECAMEPARVTTALRFASLDVRYSGGFSAACGTTSAGEAYCWGATGDLTGGAASPAVVPVSAALRFTSFSFPCGVTSGHDAWCFGNPALRGAPAPASSSTPTQVTGAGIWRIVTGGLAGTTHRCGVTTTDVVACWGNNTGGKLGTGDTAAAAVPVPVQSAERFSTVAVQNGTSCALTLDQRLFCWGGGRLVPTQMSETLRFTALALSEFGVCALGTDGVPYCRSYTGAMARAGPPGTLLQSLTSGSLHYCGMRLDGIAVCWGPNSSGELGAGDLVGRGPTAVVGQ